MKRHRVTTLGYALLGLIRAEPRSGYALRMQFEKTPIGHYSSSPGSIYPALSSLEAAGFVMRQETDEARTVYNLTPAGGKELRRWLSLPVDQATFETTEDEYLLRFALMSSEPDTRRTLRLLRDLKKAWTTRLASLLAYKRSAAYRAMPLHGRLSVDFGINSVRAARSWATHAAEQFTSKAAARESRKLR